MATKQKNTKTKYTYATGKRKASTARVRLHQGKGDNLVNSISFEQYFPGPVNTYKWQLPFVLTDTREKFYVTVRVTGGGKSSQLDAVVHGIAKALNTADRGKYRQPLKKAGLLTRDARIRERRVAGTGGKARRKKQSPKR